MNEDVNTVVDDEDVGITHSDDEKEVKMPNSDNGDESDLDSTNSYSGSVVKRDLPKLRFSLLPSNISKYSKNNRPLPFLKTSPIILSLPQTIFVSISSTSIKEKPDSAKAELDNSQIIRLGGNPVQRGRWQCVLITLGLIIEVFKFNGTLLLQSQLRMNWKMLFSKQEGCLRVTMEIYIKIDRRGAVELTKGYILWL